MREESKEIIMSHSDQNIQITEFMSEADHFKENF